MTIETRGFARGATGGSVRIETPTHAARRSARMASAARIVRKRNGDRMPALSHLLAGYNRPRYTTNHRMTEDLFIEDATHGVVRWRAAVRERPKSAAAQYALGVALVRSGLEDEAGAAFREAASLRPEWAEAHNALGATLCRLGRNDEGIDELFASSHMDMGFALPRFNLGMAFARCGRYTEAAGAF